MVSRQIDAVAELQNSFQVLAKNWILAVPTALVSLVIAAFLIFVVAATMASFYAASMTGGFHPGAAAFAGVGSLTLLVGFVVIVLLFLLAQAVVMAAAENVWHGQPADLGSGVSRALTKLPPLFGLFLIAVLIGLVCGVLVIAAGLGILLAIVLGFFFMFAVPAIVIGNEGVMQALGTSYRLVRANMGPSAIAFLGIVVVTLVGHFISNLFVHIPLLGIIVAFILGGLTYAYSALVAVRFYDLLRGSATPTA